MGVVINKEKSIQLMIIVVQDNALGTNVNWHDAYWHERPFNNALFCSLVLDAL